MTSISLLVQTLYLLGIIVSALTGLVIALVAWQYHRIPGARLFSGGALSLSLVVISFLGIAFTESPDLAFWWIRLRFLGAAGAVSFLFLFCLEFTGHAMRGRRNVKAVVLISVLVAIAVTFADPDSGLFFPGWGIERYELITIEQHGFGGLFWLCVAWFIVLAIIALTILMQYLRRVSLSHRRQLSVFVLATVVMAAVAILPKLVHTAFPFSSTPLAMGVALVSFAWVVFSERLFDLAPIAYDAVFGSMRDAVFILNLRDQVVQVNRQAEVLLGQTQRDVIGQRFSNLALGKQLTLAQGRSGPEPFEITRSVVNNANLSDPSKLHTFEVSISPLRIANGRVAGRLISLHDITEYKRVENARREGEDQYRLLLQNLPLPTVVVDLESQALVYSNSAIHQLLPGFPPAMTALIDVLQSLLVEKDFEALSAMLRQIPLLTGFPATEFSLHLRNGRVLYLVAHGVVTRYANRPALLIAVNDITEQTCAMQAEAEQRRFNEALIDDIGVINSTLHLDEMLERVFTNLGKIFACDQATVMLIENDEAYIAANYGFSGKDAPLLQSRLAVTEIPTFQHMIETRTPVLLSDTANSLLWQDLDTTRTINSYLGAPIIQNDDVIGFINLDSAAPNAFQDQDCGRLQAFANHIAIALQNAQTFEQAQEDAAARERQHLANELHDAVSQTLFSARVTAESLRRVWKEEPGYVEAGLEQLVELTAGALSEMRTLLVELRPAALRDTELNILLTHLVNSLKARTGATVSLVCDEIPHILPPDVKLALYRVVQEAFNNIVKHAHPTQIDITLRSHDDEVLLNITDNGAGFDVDHVSAEHMGLRIMRERAANMNLELSIVSAPRQGTSISVWWKDRSGFLPEEMPETVDGAQPGSRY